MNRELLSVKSVAVRIILQRLVDHALVDLCHAHDSLSRMAQEQLKRCIVVVGLIRHLNVEEVVYQCWVLKLILVYTDQELRVSVEGHA